MSLNFVHFIISELQRVRDRKEQDLRDLIERKMNLTQEMVDIDKDIQNPQVSEGDKAEQDEAQLNPNNHLKENQSREWYG